MIDALFNLSTSKQTQSLLKDLMNSMSSITDSKDDQLATLNEARKKALQKITTFQKALEAAVIKAAEISKKELEDAYNELEEEILQDKTEVQKTIDALQNTSAKLQKAAGNRAQRFVCTKLAETQMKEADDQMSKRKLKNLTDVYLSFTPNQSLMDYINGLHGIGEVVRHTKKRTNLYKEKGSKDINIRLTDDSNNCRSLGCCLILDNNQLLLTDYVNQKLKRFDIKNMAVIDYLKLDGNPIGVCCIGKLEAAVACESPNMIQLVSIDKKMTPTRIKMSHCCYGIATKDDKLYITDNGSSLYMYDMTGNLLKTISQDNTGNKLFSMSRHITLNESGNNMYVGNWRNDILCFDDAGNYLSTYNDNDLKNTDDVCADGRGNIFVVGWGSHNVVQFNEDGKTIGLVIKPQDGLQFPRSVCFHQKLNRLFVSMERSDVLKMYELE